MPTYKYSALDENNLIVSGKINAENEQELSKLLAGHGMKPIKIKQLIMGEKSAKTLTQRKMSSEEIALFCKQLSIITHSGISIIKGLLMVKNQAKNKKIKMLCGNLYMSIQKGRSLSEAFVSSGFRIPLLLINMIRIGEASGNLDEMFKRMAEYFEKESSTNKKIVSAMVYPAILLTISIGVIVFFTYFILPDLTSIIVETGGELPAITRFMIDSSKFAASNIVYIVVAVWILITLYFKAIPYELKKKVKDRIIFNTPVISAVAKDFITARFTRTLGMLVQTGLSMLVILETLEKIIGIDAVSKGIAEAKDALNKGEQLSGSLEKMHFFDSMVTNIISIGEETGNLGESMLDLANYYDEKFDSGVSRLIAMLEPAFTIIMGGIIAVILLSAMLPMFNMISSLSNS